MSKKDIFHKYLESHNLLIEKVAGRLASKNPDYGRSQIRSMVVSEIWDKVNRDKDLSEKALYLSTLSRVLEEKGLYYRGSELYTPFIRIEDDSFLTDNSPEDYYHRINKSDFSFMTDVMLKGLEQDEVFVMALSFGLSTPVPLKGKYKEYLDNVEDLYHTRPLTHKEIAKIMGITVSKMISLKKKAYNKLVKQFRERYNGIV